MPETARTGSGAVHVDDLAEFYILALEAAPPARSTTPARMP
jgi:hypothetical protein